MQYFQSSTRITLRLKLLHDKFDQVMKTKGKTSSQDRTALLANEKSTDQCDPGSQKQSGD